jgi:hypothetical protein
VSADAVLRSLFPLDHPRPSFYRGCWGTKRSLRTFHGVWSPSEEQLSAFSKALRLLEVHQNPPLLPTLLDADPPASNLARSTVSPPHRAFPELEKEKETHLESRLSLLRRREASEEATRERSPGPKR